MVKLSEPLRCHALYDVKTTVLLSLVIYTTESASTLFFENKMVIERPEKIVKIKICIEF